MTDVTDTPALQDWEGAANRDEDCWNAVSLYPQVGGPISVGGALAFWFSFSSST